MNKVIKLSKEIEEISDKNNLYGTKEDIKTILKK